MKIRHLPEILQYRSAAQQNKHINKEYIRLDKIRSETIRKELEIPGIQDVRTKYKQNWIIHFDRMDNNTFPNHALNYKPRGRIDRGRPRKRCQCVDAGTGQTT